MPARYLRTCRPCVQPSVEARTLARTDSASTSTDSLGSLSTTESGSYIRSAISTSCLGLMIFSCPRAQLGRDEIGARLIMDESQDRGRIQHRHSAGAAARRRSATSSSTSDRAFGMLVPSPRSSARASCFLSSTRCWPDRRRCSTSQGLRLSAARTSAGMTSRPCLPSLNVTSNPKDAKEGHMMPLSFVHTHGCSTARQYVGQG
jgi:hypothetical protein